VSEAPIVPAVPAPSALAPADMGDPLIRLAIDKDLDIDKLKELVAMKREADREVARREYFDAVALFQEECPSVKKTSAARDTTKDGAPVMYHFAALDEIAGTIRPALKKAGLSYSWDSKPTADGKLECVCRIKHRGGHSETATFVCPLITKTRMMNDTQQMNGTLTYAKRTTLISALGLTTCDDDHDAQTGPDVNLDPVGPGQLATLRTLLDETKADESAFLNFFKVERLDDVTVADFDKARGMLEAKKRKAVTK
jgi:hypothetical protein